MSCRAHLSFAAARRRRGGVASVIRRDLASPAGRVPYGSRNGISAHLWPKCMKNRGGAKYRQSGIGVMKHLGVAARGALK